ncbi:MAG: peptidoglycan DD-metalloendopeptidase family protein [Rhodospirillaceae bacterium]
MFSGKQHSKFDPQDRGLSRAQKILQRFFPERQLIVRSGERMRTLRLSTNRQAVLVTVGIILGAWTLLSSGLAMNHGERIRAKNTEIKDARVGYEQLLAQVSIYKERVADLTSDLEDNYKKSLTLAESEVELLKNKAGEIPSAKKTLVSKITSRAKEALHDPVAALSGDAGNTDLALSKSKLERGHVDEARKALLSELSELEKSMVDVVGHHQKTPFIATDSLELRQVVLQRDLAVSERESLTQKVAALENQIREMESNQLLLYHRFAEATETKIADIEDSLSVTGLDIDLLVKRQKDTKGAGGPLIPLSAIPSDSGPLTESLNQLNANVDRLQDLRGLMVRLPLDQPVAKWDLNSGFGVRKDPFTGAYAQHQGLDMGAEMRSPIFATGEGKVTHADFDGNYGRMVEIDHGMGLVTRYGHMSRILVKKGDVVKRGTIIGQLGCSGRCSGPHVHYEVVNNGRPVNPLKFLKAGTNVLKD